ncbi:Pentatricopeptide repeat-containing protein [Apostasia shenzhenica]|uniref:Pentatricopeptide repeat-containing protein n=1 Tax=Apostasia shenzhenica TaxID=1088818 RepID=A0A2I0ALS4_9ASPA|nr:Pentatricopeptide repeat-containing protein [Apostasia shenzhenica]
MPLSDNTRGLILAVVSSAFIGASFILKKKGLKRAGANGVRAVLFGEASNFVAYVFAPAVLVTPLGALSIIVSAVLSHFILEEKLQKMGILGCVSCIVGSIIIVIHAPQEQSPSSVEEIWALATQPAAAIVIVLILVLYFEPRYGQTNILVYLGICSLMGSLTALDSFNTAVVSPIYYVMFTTLTIVASAIMFKDWSGQSFSSIASEICGFITVLSGTILLHATTELESTDSIPTTVTLGWNNLLLIDLLSLRNGCGDDSGAANRPPPAMPKLGAGAARPNSCLLESLHRNLSIGRIADAVAVLPLLAAGGLRPPTRSLVLLLSHCLCYPPSLPLARRVFLFLHLTGLKRAYPVHTTLSNHILHLHFLLGCPDQAQRLFGKMPRPNIFSYNAMLTGYARLGLLGPARDLFDRMPFRDLVSWNIIIFLLARSGSAAESVSFYSRLRCTSLGFNPHTFSALLTACAHLADNLLTIQAHGQIFLAGFSSNLVMMIPDRVKPDQFAFSSCLAASSSIASLKHGKQLHARLFRMHFNPNVVVVSSLIDMYSKCGDLKGSRRVFDYTTTRMRDIVLWNTMISAAGHHGHGRGAVQLFEEMIRIGHKPNSNTFVVLLTACSHSGLVCEGLQFFKSMTAEHGITPEETHFVCLIDLLGRAGRFEEALIWLDKEPCRSSSRAWNALLGACRIHGNWELGEKAAERLVELGPQSSGTYVLLSNIYADDGNWKSMENVRHFMAEKGVRKENAASWIEVDDNIME